ncbi:unnamed protein product [Protopolystoma xenopodis]|uniref:Uncharacterized protein n=1 Tax=Protopolystoma xenopodis TaxID=117903 RepID=A0A3S5CPE5_9PLAT|nr:unnamed protein product [Protopolystoma xenopodis]
MFDSLAVMMYDLVDFHRQWANYMNKMRVIQLPAYLKKLMPNDGTQLGSEGSQAIVPSPRSGKMSES